MNQEKTYQLSDGGVAAVMMILQKALMYADEEGGMTPDAPEEVHIPTMLKNLVFVDSNTGLVPTSGIPTIQADLDAFAEHESPELVDLVEDLLEEKNE